MPNLNKRAFLAERMESILAQTVRDWELIVCDSYSDDGSWEFFQKFKSDPRVRIYQVPREGIYAGWNECLRRACGEFIYFATSDDTASPPLLENLLLPLQKLPDIQVAVCDFQMIDAHSNPQPCPVRAAWIDFFGEWLHTPSIRNGKTEFLLHACDGTVWVTMASVMFRRSLLDRIGLFRTDRGVAADIEWSMRASLVSDVAFVPEKLTTWRCYETQATTNAKASRGSKRIRLQQDALACLDSVLADNEAGIPATWKRIPNWKQEIGAVLKGEYFDSFRLYRGLLKSDPMQFAHNVWAACRMQPRFLMRQALRVFGWSSQLSPNREHAALRLIHLFQSPWPPQRMNASFDRVLP